MTCVPRLVRNRSGSSAAEFALVLPMLLGLIFLVIDGGRYLWSVNRIEKAAQWGARFAIVADPPTDAFTTAVAANYVGTVVGGVTLTQGDVIPIAALGKMVCNDAGCCNPANLCTAPYPAGTYTQSKFRAIVDRMKLLSPDIAYSNVTVTYRGSGLGYAGDPSLSGQISPLVTVTVSGVTWAPVSGFAQFKAGFPTIETTLSTEDSIGSSSY